MGNEYLAYLDGLYNKSIKIFEIINRAKDAKIKFHNENGMALNALFLRIKNTRREIKKAILRDSLLPDRFRDWPSDYKNSGIKLAPVRRDKIPPCPSFHLS